MDPGRVEAGFDPWTDPGPTSLKPRDQTRPTNLGKSPRYRPRTDRGIRVVWSKMKCNGKCNGKHNRNAIVLAKILVWPNAVRSWPHEHLCCYTNLTGSVLIELKCVATGQLRLDWSDWAPIARLQSVEEGKTIDESTNREPWTDIDILIKTRSILTGSGTRPRFLG